MIVCVFTLCVLYTFCIVYFVCSQFFGDSIHNHGTVYWKLLPSISIHPLMKLFHRSLIQLIIFFIVFLVFFSIFSYRRCTVKDWIYLNVEAIYFESITQWHYPLTNGVLSIFDSLDSSYLTYVFLFSLVHLK